MCIRDRAIAQPGLRYPSIICMADACGEKKRAAHSTAEAETRIFCSFVVFIIKTTPFYYDCAHEKRSPKISSGFPAIRNTGREKDPCQAVMQTIPFIHCEVTAIRKAEHNGRYPD